MISRYRGALSPTITSNSLLVFGNERTTFIALCMESKDSNELEFEFKATTMIAERRDSNLAYPILFLRCLRLFFFTIAASPSWRFVVNSLCG